MNRNKYAPLQTQGQTQSRGQQALHPHLPKPGIAQAKMAMASQMKNQPAAPPVYRPQPKPVPHAVQLKTLNPAPTRQQPDAPAAYRPQPLPKVLQTKSASNHQSRAVQAPRQPVASPVYRPETKKIVQPKMAVAAQTGKPPKSPPVYRPEKKKILQPKSMLELRRPPTAPPASGPGTKLLQPKMTAARAHTPPKAPPVYRPQPTPRVLQKKDSQTPAAAHGLGKPLPHKTHNVLSANVVQRVVINMDPTDKAIAESARIHKQRDDAFEQRDTLLITGSLPLMGEASPFSTVGDDEEITILAHGTPDMGGDVPRVAGKTAKELFQHLVAMGFKQRHTGMINLSNCTSAWDRKGTGSFADKFASELKKYGFNNYVTGYESFTESVSQHQELEVPVDKREIFLAHKITERYLMRLMNLHPKDAIEKGGLVLTTIHGELKAGANQAFIEADDFLRKKDDLSQKLGSFYVRLAKLLLNYLATVGNSYNEKEILNFQIDAMSLMKEYGFDNLGTRLHNQKKEAIPVLLGGGFS